MPLVVAWHHHVGQLGGRWLDTRQEGGAAAALQGGRVTQHPELTRIEPAELIHFEL